MERASDDWRDDPDEADHEFLDGDGDGELFADQEDDHFADENTSDEDFTDDDEQYAAQLYSILYAVDHFHF